MNDAKIDSFIRAFQYGGYGCNQCNCGQVFYDDRPHSVEWEEDEYYRLEKDPNAKPVQQSVCMVEINGKDYCTSCDCWHEKAMEFMLFLDSIAQGFVYYLREEKERKRKEYERSPVVEEK